jgi:hypothetical protein
VPSDGTVERRIKLTPAAGFGRRRGTDWDVALPSPHEAAEAAILEFNDDAVLGQAITTLSPAVLPALAQQFARYNAPTHHSCAMAMRPFIFG